MSAANYQAGQLHRVSLAPGVDLDFRYIPPTGAAGFRMGSRGNDPGEEPVHRVKFAQGFWLGETPVTQAQFAVWTAAVGEKHKNEFSDHDDHPAENMDWWQAVRFCDWLTKAMAVDERFPAGANLACLPTEAEWEYACRAGTDTDYYSGDGEAALAQVGRFEEPWETGTRPVRQGEKNAWGLHDLHGHVWQWCHDVLDERAYRRRLEGDPDAGAAARAADYATAARWQALLEDRQLRVMRGGSWLNTASFCRSAFRGPGLPADRVRSRGFRLCLAPGPVAEPKPETEQEKAQPRPGDGGRGTSPESDGRGGAGARAFDWGGLTLPAQPAEK